MNLVAIDDKAINEPDYTDFVLRVLEDITEEYHDIAINRETEMQTINQLLGRFQILDNDDQVDK